MAESISQQLRGLAGDMGYPHDARAQVLHRLADDLDASVNRFLSGFAKSVGARQLKSLGTLIALGSILDERDSQDRQWGGAAHDDTHAVVDWIDLIGKHLDQIDHADGDRVYIRKRYVEIGALACAAIESLDRKATM